MYQESTMDTEECIFNALAELGKDDFSTFKARLQHSDNLGGLKRIPWGELENAGKCQTAQLIYQTYTTDALQVVGKVLKKIPRIDLLKLFPEIDAASSSATRSPHHPSSTSTHLGNSSAAVLGGLLCTQLKCSAIQAVHDKTAIDLAGEMKSCYPPFNGNRLNLEKHVLKSLAEKEDFDSYMNYIRDPRKFIEQFIEKRVEEYISTNKNKVLSIMKATGEGLVRLLNDTLCKSIKKVKTQCGDTNTWLKLFSSLLEDVLRVDCYGDFNDIDDFDFLEELIKRGLDSMKVDLYSMSINMVDVRVRPHQILIDMLCNCCWVQCPFCGATCTNTISDHSPDDHCARFHRPVALQGRYCRRTAELDIAYCTTLVASDRCFNASSGAIIPYKEYRRGGPEYRDWSITPDESRLTYWKWFVCRFQKDLEKLYGKTFEHRGKHPDDWKWYTNREAIESLENM